MDDIWFALIMALMGGLAANVIELPLIWWFTRPTRLLERLSDPSEPDKESLAIFFDLMLERFVTPTIKTGEKIRREVKPAVLDANGRVVKDAVFREEEEVVSPFEMLIEKIGDAVMNKLRGLQGSLVRDAGKLFPAKGQSNAEFLMQRAFDQLMPKIENSIAAKIEQVLNPQNKGGFG